MGERESETVGVPEIAEAAAGPRDRDEELARATGLEQVREILFGATWRELERKLIRTGSLFTARAEQLEQGTRRRTEVLETHLQREIESLTTRYERELVETRDALRDQDREHREALARLEQRVAKVEEASARGVRELRQEMLAQAKSFLDELHHLRKELLATLRQELDLVDDELGEGQGEVEMGSRH